MTLAESMIELPGGASVHVTEAGRGPALVCLHAGVADARSWRAQQQSFSGRWRVIAYDRRGFGRTRCPPQPFAHVDDLIALLDALRIGQAVLMGCSQGGRIAIDAALAYPDRVRALVLVAAAISGAPEWADLPAAMQPRFDALAAAEARGDLDAVNRLEAEIWLDGPLQAPGRVGGAVRELFLEMNGTALRAPSPGAAIDELKRVDDTGSADWNNLMGYSLRKSKTPDYAAAEKYYDEALRIAPAHRNALEYSGELYLMLEQLPKAEQRLAALDKACSFGCEQYTELKKAVQAYKANGNRYVAAK